MQKNNIKNFVCSFIFSVLAVLAVQKVFLRAPDTPKNESKPEQKVKNISLFNEKQSDTPYIDMAGLKENEPKISQIASLSEPEKVETFAQNEPFEVEEKQEHEKTNTVISTDINEASEIKLSDAEIDETRQIRKHIESGIVYADISDTLENEQDSTQSTEQIPLFASTDPMYDKIEVSSSAKSSEIAMVEPNTLINSMQEPDVLEEEKNLAEADIKKNELGELFDISESEDNPWLMAKGNKYAKNQAVVEQFKQTAQQENEEKSIENSENSETTISEISDHQDVIEQTFSEPLLKEKSSDTKLAYQMIQNILIPIPQDILSDGNLTPDLTSSPEEKEVADKQSVDQNKTKTSKNISQKDEQTGLFKSISSWFSKNAEETSNKDMSKDSKSDKKKKDKDSKDTSSAKNVEKTIKDKSSDSVFDSVQNYEYRPPSYESIVPAELRLSFQPNKAEISGQTLKWIYAFADNARDNDDIFIEIRIDGTSSCVLQQKRLNLLSTILRARGVDYRKINTIFTSREPNSFIIRNIRFNTKEETKKSYGQ